MLYQKKPIVVEAEVFNLDIWKAEVRHEGVSKTYPKVTLSVAHFFTPVISTLEGDMIVSDGDYIIEGVNGEYYPCKPDIFAKTYEPVIGGR